MEPQLLELLSRWKHARARGQAVSAEELCRANPDLVPRLREQIDLLDHLDAITRAPADSTPFATSGTWDTVAPPARRVGPFLLLELLGQGGMGQVYRAEDTLLNRIVALKLMRPEVAREADARARFLREARTAARLHHDHIVPIFQVGEDQGVPYLAMPLLAGESLQSRLQREPILPVAEVLRIARETAEGLTVAHAAGLIHRDIKPANLWLEGPNGRVKILDFGLAKEAQGADALTILGEVMGTPGFMSPEQAAGVPVDVRTDLFSLGCVMYQMATGDRPFSGNNLEEMLRATQVETPTAVEVRQPGFPRRLAELTTRLMARHPGDRPPAANAVVEELRGIAREIGPARWTRVLEAPQPRQRRYPVPGVALFALVAALLTAGLHLYPKLQSQPNETPAATVTQPPLKIGVIHSLTGTLSIHERPTLQATELAVEEINQAGGVLSRPIELVVEDGRSMEEVFAAKARKLIEKDKVDVLFGCWTSSSRKRVAEVCQSRDRLLFYAVGSEGLENSPNVVHLGGMPNQTMIPLVRWAYAEKGKRRFFLIGSDEIFSRATEAILSPEIKRLGGELVGASFLPFGETEFHAEVARMRESKADVVINTLDGQSNTALLRALRAAGIRPATVPVVWNSISEAELPQFRLQEMLGDYTVGCYFESLPRPENQAFVERFRKRFGVRERVNDPMQTAYFGVYLWKNAVEKAGSAATTEVREALRGLRVEAPEGTICLDRTKAHAYRTARIGEIVEIEDRAQFEIVYSSPGPLRPEPFPAGRSEKEWKAFLDVMYRKWGGHWERHP